MKKLKQKFIIQKEICFRCNKKINRTKDNYLSMTSYNDGELIEEVIFCLPKCWGDYNSQRVNEHLGKMVNMGSEIFKQFGIKN